MEKHYVMMWAEYRNNEEKEEVKTLIMLWKKYWTRQHHENIITGHEFIDKPYPFSPNARTLCIKIWYTGPGTDIIEENFLLNEVIVN